MLRSAVTETALADDAPASWHHYRRLIVRLGLLAAPIAAENFLHTFVGLTDTYLANQVDTQAAAAIAPMAYILWFVGIATNSVGTGSTALISRATGARDKRTARAALGQSFLLAAGVGVVLGLLFVGLSGPAGGWFGLSDPKTQAYISTYLWIVGLGVPFAVFAFVGNSCLRGAGDTLTPMIAMFVIDAANLVLSFAFVYGWGPVPALGWAGIAIGTALAYGLGAFVVAFALLGGHGASGLKLIPHRLRPHWHTTRRILRVGVPSLFEGVSFWGANFVVLVLVGTLGNSDTAAHNVVVRIEAFSFMTGFALSTAAATMVGQALGRRDPDDAKRSGTLAFVLGAVFMGLCGVVFLLIPRPICALIAADDAIADAAAGALQMCAAAQLGFCAAMVFGGSLRGAGDTTAVMIRNLGAAFVVRLGGTLIVVYGLNGGLTAVWVTFALDQWARGILLAVRFYRGRWTQIEV